MLRRLHIDIALRVVWLAWLAIWTSSVETKNKYHQTSVLQQINVKYKDKKQVGDSKQTKQVPTYTTPRAQDVEGATVYSRLPEEGNRQIHEEDEDTERVTMKTFQKQLKPERFNNASW